MTRPTGMYSHISDIDYHADTASLSSSGAKLILDCPARFRARMDAPPKPKREFDIGHVAHRLILGKGSEFVVLDPAVHGLTKDGTPAANPRATTAWKQAEIAARSRDLVPIHADDFAKAEAMAKAVHEHPYAGRLLADGQAEVSLYVDDPGGTGVKLRARPDWMTEVDGRVCMLDAKTTTNSRPGDFARKAAELGYHVQDAFYRLVARALELDDDPLFVFVPVEKEPPHLVSTVRFDHPDDIAEADRLVRKAIDTYARCVETGEWPAWEGTEGLTGIRLPVWHRGGTGRTATTDTESDAAAAALIAELEALAG